MSTTPDRIPEMMQHKYARAIFKQILMAMNYMHRKGLAHCDIKPENIGFTDDFSVKILDFGLFSEITGYDGTGWLNHQKGTPEYMAPEIRLKHKYQPKEADLFAAAVTLFRFVTGYKPFQFAWSKDYQLIYEKRLDKFWRNWTYQLRVKYEQPDFEFDRDFKSLMSSMFMFNRSERLPLSDIIQSPYMRGEMATQEELRAELTRRTLDQQDQLDQQQQLEQQMLQRRVDARAR